MFDKNEGMPQLIAHGGPGDFPPMHPKPDYSYIKRSYLDVKYGEQSESQRMDIYLPENGEGPFPVILFIHGGAFCMCDKADHQVSPYLEGINRGYAIISTNYRLSGEAIFPAGIMDIKAAIRFIRANANTYMLDAEKIVVAGGSSGANYTCMICVTSNRPELEDLGQGNDKYSCAVLGGVAWFPPTDFCKMDDQLRENNLGPCDHNNADSPESRYMGGKITDLPNERVQQGNPMTYVHKDMAPMMIQHGRKDHLVPYQQSAIFVEKIKEVCGEDKVIFEILENADHGDPLFETEENMEKVFVYFDKIVQRMSKL